MALNTLDTLKKESEDADKAIAGVKEPEVKAHIIEDPKPTDPIVGAKVEDPPIIEPKIEPKIETVDELQTVIAGLKLQLEDENNPTAQQRYLTLQGMLTKANEDIKELKAAKVEAPAAPTITATETHNETLSKLKQDYGDEVVTLFKDLIKESFSDLVGTQLKEQGERINTVEDTQGKTDGEIFISNVTNAVPDWKQINGWEAEGIPQDPKWTVFLGQRVPGTTMTYNDVIQNSWSTRNLSSVVEVFKLFKSNNKPAQDVVIPPAIPVSNVNDHIDPDTTGGAGTVQGDKKKTYAKDVIDAFYQSITKKQFLGTIAERDALDDEYQQAIVDGRVF